MVSANEYNRRLKQAVNQYNRQVTSHNRKVDQYNRNLAQGINRYNQDVDRQNRRVAQQNRRAIQDINRMNQAARPSAIRYSPGEQALVDRVQAAAPRDNRRYDVFLSYARVDGAEVAGSLRDSLNRLGISVWFDAVSIRPGKSQSLQMDRGLATSTIGVVVLTPAYIAGRFWTERELGALLRKDTLIPVLDRVTFDQVAEYSGILPDLAGFSTEVDPLSDIAEKIAGAVPTSNS